MLNHNYRAATRPRTILFISKDYDAVNQVMDYVLSLIEEFDWMKKMFYYDKTEHIFYLRTLDPVSGKHKILAQCKFYSALGNLPGVGDAADAVFFDEAMYVPTSVKDGIMKIVDHEGARLLVVSTFYDEAPGTNLYYWPVNLCNKFEAESSQIVDPIQHIIELYYKHRHNTTDTTYTIPDEVAGLRYTIDDIEVITDKDGAKAALQDNPESFMRQLYCRYLEKEGVFNYKASIVPSKFVPPSSDPQFPQPHYLIGLGDMQRKYIPQRTRIVTAYDPALTSDMSAWLDSAYDEKRNKIIIFKELELNLKNKASFIPQAHLIKDHITTYLKSFKVPILKSMDSSHPAVSDAMA